MGDFRRSTHAAAAAAGTAADHGPLFPPLVLTALFAFRAAALFVGLDRLPALPSVFAEVIINDPAVSLSRGHGLVAFSVEGSVNGFDRLYAHFPPLFIFIQSLVFRLFGFSALSLRGLTPLFDLAACAVFLVVVRELQNKGVLDRSGARLASLAIVLEPTLLLHSRVARMESLNALFGGIVFWLCLRAARGEGRNMPLWTGAAAAAGAALTTHPAALLIVAVLFVWSTMSFRRLGVLRWLALNALPGLILVAVSAGVYGAKLPDAVAQLRHISITAPRPDLRLADLVGSLLHHRAFDFERAGGLGLVFTLAGFGLAVWRLSRSSARGRAEWPRELTGLAAVLLLQFALLQFAIPTSGQNRAVMITPFGLICAGIALAWLPGASRKIMAGAVIAAVLQCGLTVAYLSELRHGWRLRAPDRFDAIVEALPRDARVAGPPELWYSFLHHDRRFAIIYLDMGEKAHWARPDAFQPYDAVILDPGFPDFALWRARAEEGRPAERMVHTFERDFLVVARSFNAAPAAKPAGLP